MLDKKVVSLLVVIVILVVLYAAYSYSKGGQDAAETLAGRILPDPKRSEYGIVRD